MPRKHITTRVRKGLYNYRAYMVWKIRGGFITRDEDGEQHTFSRTLRAMKRRIDGWWREELREAWRANRQ